MERIERESVGLGRVFIRCGQSKSKRMKRMKWGRARRRGRKEEEVKEWLVAGPAVAPREITNDQIYDAPTASGRLC